MLTCPLVFTESHDPAFPIEQATADLDEATKTILRESGAWDRVAGVLAESWLMGEPVSILTAVARADAWPLIAPVAYAADSLDFPSSEVDQLASVVGSVSAAA